LQNTKELVALDKKTKFKKRETTQSWDEEVVLPYQKTAAARLQRDLFDHFVGLNQ
jgi:hypothetical protein